MTAPVYVDYAATQPMRQVAIDAWVAASGALNSGAVYASGRKARSLLDEAREQVAALLGCEPIEVVFTSSGTEADNIAIQGLYKTRVAAGAPQRIISTGIEHPAVRDTVAHLQAAGAHVDLMPISSSGHVDLERSHSLLQQPAAVATCMWANNETGAIQPVESIVQALGDAAEELSTNAPGQSAQVLPTPVHVDAVQVVGKVDVDFHALGATTLAASAHKFGGPRGIGLLLARRSPAPQPIAFGGGQERGLRPGTVDVASACALAAALAESCAESTGEETRLRVLRNTLLNGLMERIEKVHVNSVEPVLPSHLHVSFAGTDADSLIMLLDAAGIEASAGSACHAGVNRMSHVLEAMGVSEEQGRGSLRFSLGRDSSLDDVERIIALLPGIVERARAV